MISNFVLISTTVFGLEYYNVTNRSIVQTNDKGKVYDGHLSFFVTIAPFVLLIQLVLFLLVFVNCSKISLGKNVVIRPGSMLFADIREKDKGNIIIEDNVLVGSGVHIYVSNHKYGAKDTEIFNQGHFEAQNTILKQGCWIGANAILLPGVTIGNNAIVGVGSIVTRSVSNNTIVGGNPAKLIKKI